MIELQVLKQVRERIKEIEEYNSHAHKVLTETRSKPDAKMADGINTFGAGLDRAIALIKFIVGSHQSDLSAIEAELKEIGTGIMALENLFKAASSEAEKRLAEHSAPFNKIVELISALESALDSRNPNQQRRK